MGDEEFSQKYDDYRRKKNWDQEDEMDYSMSDERLGNLCDKDHQRFRNGNQGPAKLADVPETAGHVWGAARPLPKHVGAAAFPKNDARPGIMVDHMKGDSGDSLDELFTIAARASDDKARVAEKNRLEQKLQYEMFKVRQTNPDYKRLVEEGRKDEADEMIVGAANLIRIRHEL